MAATYCEVALPVPLPDTFTYRIPEGLAQPCVGGRVIVPFGARKLVGVVTALAAEPRTTKGLKDVVEVVDSEPLLPPVLLELARWMTEYYLAPPGEVFRSLLPLHDEFARSERARLRPLGIERLNELEASRSENDEYQLLRRLEGGKTRTIGRLTSGVPDGPRLLARLRREGLIEIVPEVRRRAREGKDEEVAPLLFEGDWAAAAPPVLTGPQQRALEEIEGLLERGGFATVLLEGVTGSGKTEVYSRAIQSCLERDRTALLLVPEIALTPAVAELFVSRFGDRVAVLHSGLTPRERSTEWWRLRRGEARVAVGTRSAVFAPLEDVAVVIVDEEQDASYKQAETPRYHGRDTAVVRAKLEGALAILGSATPSLETSYYARNAKYRLLQLETRVADRPLAEVRVVDMRAEFQETKKVSLFSRALVEGIEQTLASGNQALVLLNRRGYANCLLCRKCGATVQCKDCSIALVYHRGRGRLICHYCGFARTPPKACEKCGSEHIHYIGGGAEKVELELRARFAGARIARLDRDVAQVAKRGAQILRQFVRGELDLLVGTQMIAKGHDFQGVTLVGVVSADGILSLPDFRAAERTFQLLTQVAGRAGRGALPGTVLVQTYYPDHYAIRAGAEQSFEKFYEQELRFRRLLHYPPFTALANVLVRDPRLERAVQWTRTLQDFFGRWRGAAVRVLGPAPAPIARLRRNYRFQFLLKSPERRALQELLGAAVAYTREREVPPGALIVDVDPLSLI
ncbi:MAG TPA: primosomal protein N' [Candidatus Xenobia bacterium]|nr:primosomal protein N' [Candidatus Xenobia bacterium]